MCAQLTNIRSAVLLTDDVVPWCSIHQHPCEDKWGCSGPLFHDFLVSSR